jgi:hypothetical protein
MYARFTDVVDNFTDVGMTRDQAASMCVVQLGMTVADAVKKVNAADADLARFRECLDTIELIHGRHESAVATRLISEI